MLSMHFVELLAICISFACGLQVRHFIFRGSCRNVAVWKRHTVDAKLNVEPIKETNAKTEEVCSHECLKHDRCVSYNYHPTNEQCELLDTHQFAEQATFMQSKGWTYADATKSGEFNYFEGKCSGEQHEEMDLYGCWPTCDGESEYHYERMYTMLEAMEIHNKPLFASSGIAADSLLQPITSDAAPWIAHLYDERKNLSVDFGEEVEVAALLIRGTPDCYVAEFSIGIGGQMILDDGETAIFQLNPDTKSKLHIFEPVLKTKIIELHVVKFKEMPCATWEAYKYKNEC